ncbi:hypothetical protein [Streptacidiphilus sp. MAP12-20]|uniref:hypothetical protein n=1 Tax=Streptacidiphilus sp. MAP12-20 TaxID=3156299 RepID=UPI003518A288
MALALVGAVPAAAATTRAESAPSGAGTGIAAKRAVLRIRITDLPAGLAASVHLTGPSGYHRTVTGATVLSNLLPGTYAISALSVQDTHGTAYVPNPGPGTLTLAAGSSTLRTVDYFTRVPATTRPVAASAVAAVVAGASGRLTVAVRGTARYAPGQILAAGIGPHTPDGLLAKVTAVRIVPGGETVTAVPATLRQAFPQGQLNFAAAFASQSPGADPGTSGAGPATSPAASPTPAVGLPSWIKTLKCGNTANAHLTGTLTASLSTAMQTHWSLLGGVTASATATARESSSLTAAVDANAQCTLAPVELGTPRTLGVFDVQIGPIPVVVVPRLSFFVQGAFSGKAGVNTSVGQSFTATAGLSYANGAVSPIASAVESATFQPPMVTGTAHVAVSVSARLTLALYGLTGPTVNLDPGLDLSADVKANPWWTLDGTLDAGGTLKIPALGINASNSKIISKRFPLAHAAGPFPPFAVTDVPTRGNAADGPVLGLDGRLSLVGWDTSGLHTEIEAVDPKTQAIQTYRQAAPGTTGPLSFTGPLAFDGAGDLWLEGDSTGGSLTGPVLIRFTPSSGLFASFANPAACLTPPNDLSAATDGYVWASCAGYASDTVVSRISSGGTITTYHAPSGAPDLTDLVPGANGSMWALGSGNFHSDVVEIGTDGQATLFTNPVGVSGRYLAGNGTGHFVEDAICGVGSNGKSCYLAIGPGGGFKQLGTLPSPDTGEWGAPVLDKSGNFWTLVNGSTSGAVPIGHSYYYEITPLGAAAARGFDMPASDRGQWLQPTRSGAPIVTSDGALWLEQAQWPLNGHLLRLAFPLN